MILDANGMPVLQPLVDNASTATFNAAFAAIGTSLAPVGRIPVLADLGSLSSVSASAFEGRIVHIDEGGANFQAQDGVWTQISDARFASAATRDTAYAKGSAAYRVAHATVFRTDLNATEEYLNGAWRVLAEDTGWATLTLQNSWTAFGGTAYAGPGYRRQNGKVKLGGLIKGGAITAGTVIGVLPAGFRPRANSQPMFPVAGSAFGILEITSAGSINITSATSNTYMALDSIEFFAEL